MKLHAFFFLLAFVLPMEAQQVLVPAPATQSNANNGMSAYAAERENALAPAFAAQQARDFETAYKLFQQALQDYPRDARTIMLTANAARSAGHPEEALALYERTMKADHYNSNRYLPAVIQLYASLGRWADFDEAQKKARQASLAGDPVLSSSHGYVIEDYTDATRHIQVLEFPGPFGRFHTRYRFLTLSAFDPVTHFTPYFDLESDDIDQVSFKQQHPDKAASGDRAFSLDSYPRLGTQALLKFYDGEPSYETVRSDVLAALPKMPTTTPPGPAVPTSVP